MTRSAGSRALVIGLLVAGLIGVLPSPGETKAQGTVSIGGTPGCASCRVEATVAVTLRDEATSKRPVVGATNNIVHVGDRIVLIHESDPTGIHMFAWDGGYIRSIGSKGEGPGEFVHLEALAVADDGNVHAFDDRQRRRTILSPALEVVGTSPLPLAIRQVVMLPEGLVARARSSSPERVGLPLHLLNDDLEVVESFGAIDETVRPDMPLIQERVIAKGREGFVWSAYITRYAFEEWDPATGTRLHAFERAVDWFPAWTSEKELSFDEPPQPYLQGIWEDADGLLWVISLTAAESWADGLEQRPESPWVTIVDYERVYNTHVEVFDPDRGVLLASRRFARVFLGFTSRGLLIAYHEKPDGETYLELLDARLTGLE